MGIRKKYFIIINPNTAEVLLKQDGTLYTFPSLEDAAAYCGMMEVNGTVVCEMLHTHHEPEPSYKSRRKRKQYEEKK